MIKKYSGHIIGFLSSIVFFMSLAYIVKPSSESLKNENSFRVVDFIRLKKDTSLKEKSRTIPDKPEPPKKPPPPELVTPELSAPPQVPNLDIEFPDFESAHDSESSDAPMCTIHHHHVIFIAGVCHAFWWDSGHQLNVFVPAWSGTTLPSC